MVRCLHSPAGTNNCGPMQFCLLKEWSNITQKTQKDTHTHTHKRWTRGETATLNYSLRRCRLKGNNMRWYLVTRGSKHVGSYLQCVWKSLRKSWHLKARGRIWKLWRLAESAFSFLSFSKTAAAVCASCISKHGYCLFSYFVRSFAYLTVTRCVLPLVSFHHILFRMLIFTDQIWVEMMER